MTSWDLEAFKRERRANLRRVRIRMVLEILLVLGVALAAGFLLER